MNQRIFFFSLLWVLTLITSYLIGSRGSGNQPEESAGNSSSTISSLSDRTLDRSGPSENGRGLRPSERLARNLTATQAVVELAQLSDPLERSRGFLALIDQLAPEDFLSVVEEFRALGITEQRMPEYQLLLSAWAKADPYAALGYATENTGGDFARNTILATWAKNDLDAALLWAETKHEGEEANPYLVGIIRGIADLNPTRAAELTETLPFSRERGQALRSTINAMMLENPEGAKAWAETLGDERLQVGAVAYVAESLAEEEPQAAAEWISTVDNVDAQERAAEDVAELYASADLESAKTWAESLAPEALDDAAAGVVDFLVREDPIKAAEWLSQLGQNDVNLDEAIGELVRGSSRRDPYLAATWISGFSNTQEQERYYHRVIGPWMQSNPSEAREFLSNNEVPESITRRFKNR